MNWKRGLAKAVTQAEKFAQENPIATGFVTGSIVIVIALLLLRT